VKLTIIGSVGVGRTDVRGSRGSPLFGGGGVKGPIRVVTQYINPIYSYSI